MGSVTAFGGGPLIGEKLVRVAYVDETGHSAKEKVAIVAGVILDPDRQWRQLADAIDELRTVVPERFQEGFFFHATDLEYGGKHRREWPDEDRWALLDRLLAIPRVLSIPLVVGFIRKPESRTGKPHQDSKIFHAMAYGMCVKAADWYMETQAGGEVAMLVAEQRKEAREAVEATHRLLSSEALMKKWMPDFMRRDFPITRIKGPPSFATKFDEPLLQIADACAFAFQRHINGAKRSEQRIEALFGDFAHPAQLGPIRSSHGNWGCFTWQRAAEGGHWQHVES